MSHEPYGELQPAIGFDHDNSLAGCEANKRGMARSKAALQQLTINEQNQQAPISNHRHGPNSKLIKDRRRNRRGEVNSATRAFLEPAPKEYEF